MPTSPAIQLLYEILDDGEWHTTVELVEKLETSGIPLPNPPSRSTGAALQLLNRLKRYPRFELRVNSRKRNAIEAVRKRPGWKAYAKTEYCAECGAGPLTPSERIRREVKFYRSDSGSNTAATFKTKYLCLNDADHEVEVKGGTWINRPVPIGEEGNEEDA